MATRVAPVRKSLRQATVVFYPSRSANASERLLAAQLLGGIVLRGEDGARDALRLYGDGWNGPLWLDPSNHEKPHSKASTPNLLGQDSWLVDQQRVKAAELLSAGTHVAGGDRRALVNAISAEGQWLTAAGSGRMSLALEWSWLTDGLPVLLAELGAVQAPLAIAFADPNDPLGHPGAVRGLASLLWQLPNVMVLRGDMAALGAIAYGAVMGAIGTSTSVRHVVPPEKPAGGPRTGFPSVFCLELLDWKLADRLGRLPASLRPRCHLTCCNGATLDRFATIASPAEARVHNLVAMAHFANQILGVPASHRDSAFKQACRAAVQQAGIIETHAKQPFPVRPQLAAWAVL